MDNNYSFTKSKQTVSVDSKLTTFSETESSINESAILADLKNSKSLDFLKEEPKLQNIFDKKHWSLYEGDKALEPLEFSNKKTQEDIVTEVVESINEGNKIIFLHGVCGTGKSAIALNIARSLGRASIVVPVKALQKQYEEDYMGKKHVIKPDGKKMKIAMITGRENHDSLFFPGKSCADQQLPETIAISEKNYNTLREYYLSNPYITNTDVPPASQIKRLSIAPANPYWSPILPAALDIKHIKGATKRTYKGLYGQEYTFYHRKTGCSYYDQYISYFDADVIIFNSAKYLAETTIGRKPATDVEIIDEADEFLDSLSNQIELNLTRLGAALRTISPEEEGAREALKKVYDIVMNEEANKRALGVDETQIYPLVETKLRDLLTIFNTNTELTAEVVADELHYANTAVEAARLFKELFADTYVTYKKEEDNLHVILVTTNLSSKFAELVKGNKALVLMSGTLHTEAVLKHVFGIKTFKTVEAETLSQGAIDIKRVGGETDCKYANFRSEKITREQYLTLLNKTVETSQRPSLVHVHAYNDLPTEEEKISLELGALISQEQLRQQQAEDKTGRQISVFKSGLSETLFSTKCARGVDFPGDTCKSIIYTKYPNPNINDTFWKIFQRTHPQYFWEFYKDKAWRGFLQRLYRAIRSREDHVFVLSPDTRVLDAVRRIQDQLHTSLVGTSSV